MNKKYLPYSLRLLKEHNLLVTFVDVGSRNGLLELADIAPFVEGYGFEPNPVEYEKLISGKTDLFLRCGVTSPPYRRLFYQPYALGDTNGPNEFFITPGPGACGVLEPNLERLSEVIWKGESKLQSTFAEEQFNNYESIKVEMKTLDAFAEEKSINHIDYLKIDVEGYEYQVFHGGSKLLPKTAVIKVEVCFIPFRKEQKLFSHVDLLLREYDFDLLHYEVHQGHVGYKERKTPVDYVPVGYLDPYGQPLSCDAIYVNRNIQDPKRILAQSIVLLEKGYIDEALHILRTKTAIHWPEFLDLLKTHTGCEHQGKHWRALGYKLVDQVVSTIGRLTHLVRG